MLKCFVDFSRVEKELKILPKFIVIKLQRWAEQIEYLGIREVRKISGYHDEPLKGNRKDQRSIRLNRAYRAIYIEVKASNTIIIRVIEANKHEY